MLSKEVIVNDTAYEFTTRDIMSLDSAIYTLRKHYETLEGLEMSKLELYRVHKVLNGHMTTLGMGKEIEEYTFPKVM